MNKPKYTILNLGKNMFFSKEMSAADDYIGRMYTQNLVKIEIFLEIDQLIDMSMKCI